MKNQTNILPILLLFILVNLTASSQVISLPSQNIQDSKRNEARTRSELVYIHTDRDMYIAGENLFFKVYFIPGDSALQYRTNSIVYMIIRNEKQNILKAGLKLEKGIAYGNIYIPDTIKTGAYQIVAFTNYMKNTDEQRFFSKRLVIINRFDKLLQEFYVDKVDSAPAKIQSMNSFLPETNMLKIEMEKDHYATREKIKIDIRLAGNGKNNNFNALLSVSVREDSPFEDKESYENFCHLLSSPDFVDQHKIGLTSTYVHEFDKVQVVGTLVHRDSLAVADSCLFLSTIDSVPNLQYTFTNSSGNFNFMLNNYYLGKNLFVKIREEDLADASSRIQIEDKFALKLPFSSRLPGLNRDGRKFIFASQDIVQVQKTYPLSGPEEINFTGPKENHIPNIYNTPDFICNLSEFIALTNFEEIAENLIIGFKLKKEKNQYHGYVFDFLTKTVFSRPCLVLLNGIPMNNLMQVMPLSSEDINRIELCNSLRTMGLIEFPGIISIFTSKPPDKLNLADGGIKFRFDAFLNWSLYHTPEYTSNKLKLSKAPDLRQLLYWNPNVLLRPNESSIFEFYASDYVTDYIIDIKGISADGKPLSARAKIKVVR